MDDQLEFLKALKEKHLRHVQCYQNLVLAQRIINDLKKYVNHLNSKCEGHEPLIADLTVKTRELETENSNLKQDNSRLAKENDDLDSKLTECRKLNYHTRQKLIAAVKERNKVIDLLNTARSALSEDNNMSHETRTKLSLLDIPGMETQVDPLDTILELDSTDGMMSEMSYTMEEDELMGENSYRRSKRNKRPPARFPSNDSHVSGPKRSKTNQTSSFLGDRDEHIIATTTVRVPQNGPVHAVSTIETRPGTSKQPGPVKRGLEYVDPNYLPSAPPMDSESDSGGSDGARNTPKRPFTCRTNIRLHSWQQKSHVMGEQCSVCAKKLKFSTVAVKCSNCRAICHTSCKDKAQLPCVPTNTPNTKTSKPGTISDYVPSISPMVPALVVHCIREIESRGMNEVGLYRVPGSDKDVKTLKEKLLKAKGIVDLSKISEVHTITGCLKDFLRSLKETLIPRKCWKSLSEASDLRDSEQKKNKYYQIMNDLPQPNRDTLSYLILHLQRVANSPHCKMPVSNLSKMFGPSIVGYSSNNSDNLLAETNISNKIMADLMLLPSECWEQLLNPGSKENENPEMIKTPSQSSLLGFFTNSSSSIKTVKKYRFFETP